MQVATASAVAFQPEFFRPYPITPRGEAAGGPGASGAPAGGAPATPPGAAPAAAAGAAAGAPATEARISYRVERHGTNWCFCHGPLYVQYREQMRAALEELARFAIREDMPPEQQAKIANGFYALYYRRFHEPYVEVYAELIDGPGKRALDNLCDLIRDTAIPAHVRHAAILNLSGGLDVCDGVDGCEGATLANLVAAERTLIMSAGGIRSRIWQFKELCTRAALQEEAQERFGDHRKFLDRELRYVDAAWNFLARDLGLEAVPDPLCLDLLLRAGDFVPACRAKARALLTPDRFALWLAEECLSSFWNAAPPGEQAAHGEGIPDWFDVALNEILLNLRLGADRLGLHAFVQLDEAGRRYRLRTDPTLIAVALLDAVHEEGLIDDIPLAKGAWRDETGLRSVALVYGGLAWRSRLPDNAPYPPGWKAACADAELLSVAALRQCEAAQAPRILDLAPAQVRAAIRNDDPGTLADIPPHWITDADTAVRFLQRLGDAAATCYLDRHIGHFRDHLPVGERAAFLDGVIHLRNAGYVLACSWYPDLYAVLAEVRGARGATRLQRWMAQRNVDAIDVVRGLADAGWAGRKPPIRKARQIHDLLRGDKATPMLYDAMAEGHAGAIGAWHRLLRSPAIRPYIDRMLTDLLIADRKDGVSALSAAMHCNRADAVQAYGAMLADPAILPHIRGKLPLLLGGRGSRFPGKTHRVGALMYAMDGDSASAIRAYGELLRNAAIFPHIRDAVPRLFGIRPPSPFVRRTYHRSPLWWAMDRGRAKAIDAYRDVLTSQPLLPCLQHVLPVLAAGYDPKLQVSGLHAALDHGCTPAIEAYHALLAHPAITPHIRAALPRLVRAEGRWGAPGLAAALRQGHDRAIAAYHRLLTDPAILPAIASSLPGLLAARPWGGASGLAEALAGGHARAVVAFHAMLVDDGILPQVATTLPRLLVARSGSGMVGLPEAVRAGRGWPAIVAYRALLQDPRVAPHIEAALARRVARHGGSGQTKAEQWLSGYIDRGLARPTVVERLTSVMRRLADG